MVDKGPLLTSAIIFYLSIGAAIFQVLEEPNWKLAAKEYKDQKDRILEDYPCLTKDDLDKILEVVSDAAGQGVTITGSKTFNNWNWPNAVIFAATVITTIGVEPNTEYPTLYRYFVEVWIYLGLAWLSLFFNWKVRMVIEAHKALKKRRKLRKLSLDELRHYKLSHKAPLPLSPTPNDVNIFSFLSEKQEGYNDLIKQIGKKNSRTNGTAVNAINKSKEIARSKSCSEAPMFNGHKILSLDRSPRQKRRYSFSDRVTVAFSKSKSYLLGSDNGLLLTEDHVEGDFDQDQIYENQLDKDVDLENGGVGDCGTGGQRTWEDYHALIFQNANITFIDEENFLTTNLEEEDAEEEEEDDDSKAKLSITTCDENLSNSKEEQCFASKESVFTSDCLEHGHSYEKLVEEYAKEENTES
ncbi:Potassium channel subfamily K member 5 [Channa argus]|uniref:Potassium channel subfamily K member 5 n=1 Tax=Channa argus TaxID=215402 RepID=A0A6G1QGF6_CHAAH|nr:Potassium channel subfamily K member 5 [Channa argus]